MNDLAKTKRLNAIYIVLIILLVISNVVVYFVVRQDYSDPGLAYSTKYSLIDPNRRLSDPNDLIVNIQPLRDYLKSLPEANKDWAEMSIYFEYLPTGANISVNPDLQLWPASLAKLPAAVIAMKKVEKGDWTLDTKLELKSEDADTERTPDITTEIGKSFDIKFLLERLLLESDNTAYRMLLRNMQQSELDSLAESIGLDQFFNDSGRVSAKDYSRLFRVLYTSAYLNEDNSQFLLSLMQQSEFKDFVKAGIPKDIPFAHKWGTNLQINVYADSGIVYIKNRPYMISVMIQGKHADQQQNQARANELMKAIGEKSYQYISSK